MPVKWMSSDPDENPLVELGTLERVIFEQFDRLAELGINCIELLPIEDTSQTLDWGYGTRFFFAPDYDLGSPIDTRFFVKVCHQRGIRVLMDVVMNFFSPTCPLADLALNRFSVVGQPTSNFFLRASYERNPVAIRNNVVAKLFAATNAKMDREITLAGARELALAVPHSP